jgi:hypothetical protein
MVFARIGRRDIPQFLTIGYGGEAGYQQTAEAVRDAAHEHDSSLAAVGDRLDECIESFSLSMCLSPAQCV